VLPTVTKKPFVLYIEDDTTSRQLVQRILSIDYDVMTAQNALEGLSMLQRRLPDIVLTDLNLPDLSGEVIASRIRAISHRPIPIVALTAQTDKKFRNRAIAAGCIGYITKPIEAGSLSATVKEFLNGQIEVIEEADHKRATAEIQADLTEQLEKTLRQVQEDNAALRNLERAKTAFLTQVSHELRTPLTVLSGYIQMLNQQLMADQQVTNVHRDLSAASVEGVKRLTNIMNEIVVMARLASNQLDASRAPIHISDPVQEAMGEYTQALKQRNLTLEKSGEGWDQGLMADVTLVRMAVSNLLSNAIKATPDGGKITICVKSETYHSHVSVTDTGVGIDSDHMPLLFKPFFTSIDVTRGKTSKTEFKGMGMGMGLTIVTKIVEAHHGQIWAESTGYDEQKFPGSTFHMLLPLPDLGPK
jgi:signal transduction histidine kinase